MKIRLGYVAISLGLPNVTSSSTVTYTYYQKLFTKEKKLNKLKQITLSNFNDLKKILEYNIKNKIHFYRLTSKLIPLATHPDVNWDYRKYFDIELKSIGKIINENNIRVDTHPDQFNVINSINKNVVKNTMRNLIFHANLFKDIDYPLGKMVIHVGSGVGGKNKALKRFIENINYFPKEVKTKILIENDDKTFSVNDTLSLCNNLHIPMVLDVHHYICNNEGEDLFKLLPDIFNTWKNERILPKIHFSSPKNSLTDRKHADYINGEDFVRFIEGCKMINQSFDVMIEAKKKDLALFNLVSSVKKLRKNWKWIDSTTFEL